MRRVMIIGSCGAGKSVLAIKLSKSLRIKVSHLDSLYWEPGWTKTKKEEWVRIQAKLVKEKEWIIDGNYRSTLEIRLAAADTIIFLDFPKWLCLWRSINRRIQFHNQSRIDMGEGNKERITWQFVRWILTYPRNEMHERLEKYSQGREIIVLHNPLEVEQFLVKVSKSN